MPHKLALIESCVRTIVQLDAPFLVRGSFVNRFWMGSHARPCHDLDLIYLGDYQAETVETRWREVLAHVPQLTILALSFEHIWQDSIAPGMRCLLKYSHPHGEQQLQIDIAAVEPLVVPPRPRELPTNPPITLKTIDLETAIAWKLHGLFEHLNGNWTPKTLWDLYVLLQHHPLDQKLLKQAIELAFASRLDPINIVRRLLYGDFASSKNSQQRWLKEISKLTQHPVPSIAQVLQALRTTLIPILQIENDGSLLTLSAIIDYRVQQLRLDNSLAAKQKLHTLKPKAQILSKAYPSIPHLPESRLGSSDKHINPHQPKLLTQHLAHADDCVVVQEKLDGSCVCAYRLNGQILALGRAGDLAEESANENRRLWADWVAQQQQRFLAILAEGERACGEWLAMAHGTPYQLPHEPFVLFDIINPQQQALSFPLLQARAQLAQFTLPHIYHQGAAISVANILPQLGLGHHGAQIPIEGAIWRYERNNQVLFRAKYVRHDKVDGCLLTENSGQAIVWNGCPE